MPMLRTSCRTDPRLSSRYRIVLSSDATTFDGHGRVDDQQIFSTEKIMWDERPFSFTVIRSGRTRSMHLSSLVDLHSQPHRSRSGLGRRCQGMTCAFPFLFSRTRMLHRTRIKFLVAATSLQTMRLLEFHEISINDRLTLGDVPAFAAQVKHP